MLGHVTVMGVGYWYSQENPINYKSMFGVGTDMVPPPVGIMGYACLEDRPE